MLTPPVAVDQAGLFSRTQALEAGWSAGALDRAVACGVLTALRRGVYAETELLAATGRGRHLAEARAALHAVGDPWCLARRTAAVLHGLPLLGYGPAVPQLVSPPRGRKRPVARHLRVHALHASDLCELDGLRVTTLCRTAFDIARTESPASGLVVMDAALRAGVTRDEIEDVLDRTRRWPGTRNVRSALSLADPRAESPLESLTRLVCVEEGLPVFEPQVEVWVDGFFVARVDGLFRDQLLVVESDGAMKFDGPSVLPALLAREDDLKAAGLEVFRTGWGDATRGRRRTGERLRRRLEARASVRLPAGVDLVSTTAPVVPLRRTDHYRWQPPSSLRSATHRNRAA